MKLIILDRDGVINEDSAAYSKHPDEWIAIPGSLQAIARLHQAGWKVAIASNQSGLARGYFDRNVHPDVARTHDQAAADLRRAGFTVEEVALPADLLDECGGRGHAVDPARTQYQVRSGLSEPLRE